MDARDTNTYFEWKVSNHLMSKWKNAKFKKEFCSPSFKAIGATWHMHIYPNGWKTEGSAAADLWCQSIESDEKENVSCSYYIGIDSLNHYQINFNEIPLKEGEYIRCNSPFNWRDIQNLSEITICVKVWRTGSIDANEAQLIANLYSEKMMKLRNELSVGAIARVQKENEALRRQRDETIVTMYNTVLIREDSITSLERQLEQLRNEKDREIEQLRNRDGQRQEEMMQLNNENERITRENTELNEECKETKLELRRVKTELNQLKLDPANYLQWSDSEVVDWILSIQGGYRVYEERLRVSFAAENVNGRMLSQITKDDLRGWGITDFGDRSNIYFEIQNLLNQPNQNKNDEEGASTAFMGK
eukprot:1043720_1